MSNRAIRVVLPLVLVTAVGIGGAMAALASTGASGATVMTAKSSKYGTVLVSARGRALYRFMRDRKGVSLCKAGCAALWPPLVIKSTAKPKAGAGVSAALLGTMKRSKSLRQVTYAGFPLYVYSGDHKAGDVKGEGFQGKWFLVNPKGALVKKPVSTSGGGTGGWG